MIHSIYKQGKRREREERQAKIQKLRDGITNYAFQELTRGNREKAIHAIRVAMKLDEELQD